MLIRRLRRFAQWKYALREIALIVVGVLIALAASSWWEDQQKRQREQVYMQQLLLDTRENERRINAAIAEDSVSLALTRKWMRMLNSNSLLPPEDSLPPRVPVQEFFASPDFRPLLGTYTALLETGDLQLLRAANLRFSLVAYLSSLETVRETVRHSSEQMERHEDTYFRALVPLFSQGSRQRMSLRLIETMQGRVDISLPIGGSSAARTRRLRALRSIREESRTVIRLLEAETRGQ